ncbi:hypothetical protein VTL71DRAFT_16223 [Oculimacula yallundae]|uniref:Uncharacterized protein n=1 Tax=Oculimacula yallundae TaxID=86028 RepID=A0ABR4CEF0_9HELO
MSLTQANSLTSNKERQSQTKATNGNLLSEYRSGENHPSKTTANLLPLIMFSNTLATKQKTSHAIEKSKAIYHLNRTSL